MSEGLAYVLGIVLLAGVIVGISRFADLVGWTDSGPKLTALEQKDKDCAASYGDEPPKRCDGYFACTFKLAPSAKSDCSDWRAWPVDPERAQLIDAYRKADKAANPDSYPRNGNEDYDPGFDPDQVPDGSNCRIGDC